MKKKLQENKNKYDLFQNENYVPIYSKSWWMDIVCGCDNWGVWIYEKNGVMLAAATLFFQKRGEYNYITKAMLTQFNGIIFAHNIDSKDATKASFEEKVINEFTIFISKLNIDVYEQQYSTTFTNYLPFFWNGYKAIPRYSYIIESDFSLEDVWDKMSSKIRAIVKKGQRNCIITENVDPELFYKEHNKVYDKQGLSCPFSMELFKKIYSGCMDRNSGKIVCALTDEGNIASGQFIIWDEKYVYMIIGGSMPEFQNLDTYSALVWNAIEFSRSKNLGFDFEGSMIKRISKGYREYGVNPKQYFRIRKIFSAEILKGECINEIKEILRDNE